MSTPPAAPDPAQLALARCVHETEAHAAGAGWDGPVRVFALVGTADALATDPALADLLPITPEQAADAHHLLAIEQEGLPEADTLESLLAQLAWPETVSGAAVVVERLVLPPDAESELPAGLTEAEIAERLAADPRGTDVRLAVGVLRGGQSWCAVRSRTHDNDDDVVGGPDTVPGLVAALAATLE